MYAKPSSPHGNFYTLSHSIIPGYWHIEYNVTESCSDCLGFTYTHLDVCVNACECMCILRSTQIYQLCKVCGFLFHFWKIFLLDIIDLKTNNKKLFKGVTPFSPGFSDFQLEVSWYPYFSSLYIMCPFSLAAFKIPLVFYFQRFEYEMCVRVCAHVCGYREG